MQEERGPRARNNAASNPHNSNVTWQPRIDSSTTLCARFNNSEIHLPLKSPVLNNALMMKTLRESESRENVFLPVVSRHAQPRRIILPGNFFSPLENIQVVEISDRICLTTSALYPRSCDTYISPDDLNRMASRCTQARPYSTKYPRRYFWLQFGARVAIETFRCWIRRSRTRSSVAAGPPFSFYAQPRGRSTWWTCGGRARRATTTPRPA